MPLEDVELLNINKVVNEFNLKKRRLESLKKFENRIRKTLDLTTHACLLDYDDFETLVNIILNLNGKKYEYKTFKFEE